MNGVWLDLLWPLLLRVGLLTATLPAVLWAAGYGDAALLLLITTGVVVLTFGASSIWFFRLLWRTRDWWRVRRGRIVVYHPAGYANVAGVRAVIDCCETHMTSLDRRFGFPLRGRLMVLLFKSAGDVEAVFRNSAGACALPFANAIVTNRHENLLETVRHELVHLYSARWGGTAKPLLEEGLATWLQGSWDTRPVGFPGRQLMNESALSLKDLLDPDIFYDPAHRYTSYALAASFSEFLIRRYGWERYRDASKTARRLGTDYALRKYVGSRLTDLERMWRDDLAASAGRPDV